MSTPPSGAEGWGQGQWGASEWGSGVKPPPTPPKIVPLSPTEYETGVPPGRPILIRLTDDEGVAPSTLRIAVNGVIYTLGGVEQNGATLLTELNDENGLDIELRLPSPLAVGTQQEINVQVKDAYEVPAEKTYYFSVGVGPRLIKVLNPTPGILLAHFNVPMKIDAAFLDPQSWQVNTVTPGASEMTITDVSASTIHANTAVLRHEGGGSVYELVARGIVSLNDETLELGWEKAVFELIYGTEEDPTIRLFNTIFGPVGISQRVRLRRTMDDHVINRSIALGMDEQFRLRFQTLDGTAGRDGREGVRRT